MRCRRYRLFLLPALLAWATPACDDGGESSTDCPPPDFGACDPVDQRCCASTEHCALSYGGSSFVDICIGGIPSADEGDSCQPSASTDDQACVGGLTCLQITGVDAGPVCRRLCRSDGDCLVGSCSESLPGVPVRACVER